MPQAKRKIRKNEKRVFFRSRLEKPARKVPTRIPHSTSKFWEESCQSGKEEAFVEAIEFLSARFSPLTPAKTLKVSPDIFNIVEESIDCAEEELPVTELFHRLMVRSSKYFVTQLKELEPIRPRELMGSPNGTLF
ncbi:hypothetical protein JCM33374_g1546 [Metschnikowia sp. JCM 33374]|nr:hypothetical protein JCM33374_g1546 [Metschnikowia sp. JCM 33374]